MDEQRLRAVGEPEPYAYFQDPATGVWHVAKRGDQMTICGLVGWRAWNSSGMTLPPSSVNCSLCYDGLRKMRVSEDIPEM